MFGDDQNDGLLAMLMQSQGINMPQQPNGLLSMAANSPYGGLNQPETPQQPSMMRAPMPSSFAQSADMPAQGASNAGPAPMPNIPMPPPRPPGIGTPMNLQGAQSPTPMDQQPPQPITPDGMQSQQPAGQQQPAAEPGFGERLAKAFGGLNNIYGAGLPGDRLIELGAALAHPQGMAVGLQQLAERNQRGSAVKAQQQLELAKLQRQQAGQVETAKYLAQKSGIPLEQALGLVQAGQAGSLISSTVRQPQLVNVRRPDGSTVQQWRTPGDTNGVDVGAPTPADKYTDLTDPAARAAAGVPADYKGSVQRKSDNQLVYPGKAGTEVTISPQKVEGKFEEEAAKGQAKIFNDLLEGGATAKGNLSMLNELRGLGGQISTGGTAALQGWLASNGIKVGPNVPAIEAFGSLVDKLTPQQRVPGSGATSDFDAKMLKSGLPGLIKTPEGNKVLFDTMEALERDKLSRSEIAADVLTGTKTRAEGLRALQALPDPGAAFKAWQEKNGQPPPTTQTGPQAPSSPRPDGAPISVQSLDQLRGLPKGTQFVGPDGKVRYVP